MSKRGRKSKTGNVTDRSIESRPDGALLQQYEEIVGFSPHSRHYAISVVIRDRIVKELKKRNLM